MLNSVHILSYENPCCSTVLKTSQTLLFPPLPQDLKKIKALKDLREGTAKIQTGMYLYVIMLGDPEYIRLIHEDHLVHEGLLVSLGLRGGVAQSS